MEDNAGGLTTTAVPKSNVMVLRPWSWVLLVLATGFRPVTMLAVVTGHLRPQGSGCRAT